MFDFLRAYERMLARRRVGKTTAPPRDAASAERALHAALDNHFAAHPHVADQAVRRAEPVDVRDALALPHSAERRRLEACVARWRGLAECYSGDVRAMILALVDDLRRTLDGAP